MGEKATVNVNPMEFLKPNTLTFCLPDGKYVEIRETTGADEDIISKVSNAQDGSSFNKYLAAITLDYDGKNPTANDIKLMKSRCRNYLLFKSRLFSIGPDLSFWHKFKNGNKHFYTEDLSIFDWDYASEEPIPEDFRGAIPYELEAKNEVLFQISSGRSCKIKYLTGLSEEKALHIPESSISINTGLILREFQLSDGNGNWHYIEDFRMFTAREMAEIREQVKKHDPDFELWVTVKDPSTGSVEEVSLFSISDFFFPGAQKV